MSEVFPRQTSFAAGELAPGLRGRTDLEKYASGCRTALNFFVSPFGTLVSRPGTQHVAQIIEPTNVLGPIQGVRLIPFVFSDTDTLILAFLYREIHVYAYDSTTGRAAAVLDGAGQPVIIATDFSPEVYTTMRYSQVGDTVTLTGTHIFHELIRLEPDNTSWLIRELKVVAADFPTYGGVPRISTHNVADNAEAWRWMVTRVIRDSDGKVWETQPFPVTQEASYYASEWSEDSDYYTTGGQRYVWVEGHDDRFYTPIADSGDHGGANYPRYPPSHVGTYWDEVLASTISESDMLGRSLLPPKISCGDGYNVYLRWEEYAPWTTAPGAGDPVIIGARIYRGLGALVGYVGHVGAGQVSFIDDGRTPDWTIRPPSGEDPFTLPPNEFGIEFEDNPKTTCMFEGRRVVAGSQVRPSRVWMSGVEAYYNFELNPVNGALAPISFELASGQWERIRAVIPRQSLIVLTDTGEWAVGGSGQSTLITATSIAARPLSRFGCGPVTPLEVNDHILFVQKKGTVPRAMVIDQDRIYKARDISTYSRHLFTGRTIEDWCFAEDPWSLVWAARDDGTLLSVTYLPEHDLLAWTHHAIAGGTVESVASIPEGTEDSVYLAVRRGTDLHLERFATRVITDIREAVCLDSSVTYDGRNTDADKTVTVTSVAGKMGPNHPCEVTIADEAVGGESVDVVLRVYGDAAADATDTDDVVLVRLDAWVGPHYTGYLLSTLPTEMDGSAFSDAALTTRVVEGLSHLDGSEVYALADGYVVGPLTVAGGQVTVGTEYEPVDIATVGLLYSCDFESLDVADESRRKKIVKKIHVELSGSRSGHVGPNLETLTRIKSRAVEHRWGPIPLLTDSYETVPSGKWAKHGRVGYRQSNPLPVEILGITRDIEVGG